MFLRTGPKNLEANHHHHLVVIICQLTSKQSASISAAVIYILFIVEYDWALDMLRVTEVGSCFIYDPGQSFLPLISKFHLDPALDKPSKGFQATKFPLGII